MKKGMVMGIFSALGMLLLILDTKTALSGATEGIILCIQSVIPSLFPFFVLSILLTGALTGVQARPLRFLGRLCGIPSGGESMLAVGLLGGYPVGAQAVAQAYQAGQISRRCARRMLGFCSNAGPAFIFGIVAGKFTHGGIAWLLWGIHVISAVTVGILLPGKKFEQTVLTPGREVTVPQALERSVRIMAVVCGWVVIFRVVMSFWDRWVLWLFPLDAQVTLLGLLELANGCCELEYIRNEGTRFIVAAAVLSFGGLCVAMQTVSVTDKLGTGWYFPGKVMQGLISIILACAASFLIFPPSDRPGNLPLYLAAAVLSLGICLILLRKREKKSSNLASVGV